VPLESFECSSSNLCLRTVQADVMQTTCSLYDSQSGCTHAGTASIMQDLGAAGSAGHRAVHAVAEGLEEAALRRLAVAGRRVRRCRRIVSLLLLPEHGPGSGLEGHMSM
jgi:hypothetical protein